MLHGCIEGERVGVEGSKIVDVDVVTILAPAAFRHHRERRGESPPPFSSSLASPLDGRRVPPLVHGLHGGGGDGSPSEIGSPSLFSSVSRSPDLAENHFLYSGRSVTPIALRF